MTTLEICLVVYSVGFIINSLLATHYIGKLREESPEKFVSPILVMACCFASWALWVYILVYVAIRWAKSWLK